MAKSSSTLRLGLTFAVWVTLALTSGCGLFSPTASLLDNERWALSDDSLVQVVQDEDVLLLPQQVAPRTGIIFYPGGKVQPQAYAPLLRPLAREGYLVVVPVMRQDLAILSKDRAMDVREMYPEIEQWVLAGHSLGGTVATGHALDEGDYAAVLLLAAYPTQRRYPEDGPPTLLLFGTEDGLVTADDRLRAQRLLPPRSDLQLIAGANHAQFGAYGAQAEDGIATILPTEQWRISQEAMLDFLDHLGL